MKHFNEYLCIPTISILISSCGTHYKANHSNISTTKEQVQFSGAGYDAFYGSHNLMPTWSVTYPSSAKNKVTHIIHAKDFISFRGDKDARLDSLTGYIVVDPKSKIEARLTRKLFSYDGSSYNVELPFNGSYQIKQKSEQVAAPNP